MNRSAELLETMAHLCNVEYISDLKSIKRTKRSKILIKLLSVKFTKKEVNNARNYLEIV